MVVNDDEGLDDLTPDWGWLPTFLGRALLGCTLALAGAVAVMAIVLAYRH